MHFISIFLALISSLLLWNTEHQLLKWLIIIMAILCFFFRINSEPHFSSDDPKYASFWAHAAVISFWSSVILSIFGIIKAI